MKTGEAPPDAEAGLLDAVDKPCELGNNSDAAPTTVDWEEREAGALDWETPLESGPTCAAVPVNLLMASPASLGAGAAAGFGA